MNLSNSSLMMAMSRFRNTMLSMTIKDTNHATAIQPYDHNVVTSKSPSIMVNVRKSVGLAPAKPAHRIGS